MRNHSAKGRDNAIIITCSKCGAEFDLSDYSFDSPVATIMREGKLCHHCAFWKEILEYPEQPYVIVNGMVWIYGEKTFLTDNANNTLPAFIMRRDGSVEKINYPNCIGELPANIAIEYPDTARFIDFNSYKRIRARAGMSCRAVGCYDRYHCYWYNAEEREAKGAWNTVPDHHKVGSENCPSFVNKTTMFINK